MEEKHYYTNYNGMSVPNGHTYDYIEDILNNGLYMNFDITYHDGEMDRAKLIEKIDYYKYKFRRLFNNQEFILNTYKIHLIKQITI